MNDRPFVDDFDVYFQLIVSGGVEELVDTAGQLLEKLLGLERRGEDVRGGHAVLHALLHQGGPFVSQGGVDVELRRERAPDFVEVQQRLAEQRELRREPDAPVSGNSRDLHHHATDLQLLEG